jgi:hypothetical protein
MMANLVFLFAVAAASPNATLTELIQLGDTEKCALDFVSTCLSSQVRNILSRLRTQ